MENDISSTTVSPERVVNAPFHERRRTSPTHTPHSRFSVLFKAFLGPFLALVVPAVIGSMLYMWADFRILRSENLRIGDWQKSHVTDHKSAADKQQAENIAGASFHYQVENCTKTLQRIEARLRQCELSALEAKAWRIITNEKK